MDVAATIIYGGFQGIATPHTTGCRIEGSGIALASRTGSSWDCTPEFAHPRTGLGFKAATSGTLSPKA